MASMTGAKSTRRIPAGAHSSRPRVPCVACLMSAVHLVTMSAARPLLISATCSGESVLESSVCAADIGRLVILLRSKEASTAGRSKAWIASTARLCRLLTQLGTFSFGTQMVALHVLAIQLHVLSVAPDLLPIRRNASLIGGRVLRIDLDIVLGRPNVLPIALNLTFVMPDIDAIIPHRLAIAAKLSQFPASELIRRCRIGTGGACRLRNRCSIGTERPAGCAEEERTDANGDANLAKEQNDTSLTRRTLNALCSTGTTVEPPV